jgi:hypothetical protein
MDVFTRSIIVWIFQSSLHKMDIVRMINRVNLFKGLKGIILRNDNGSQFITNVVRYHLKKIDIFWDLPTYIATPDRMSTIRLFTATLNEILYSVLNLKAITMQWLSLQIIWIAITTTYVMEPWDVNN